MFDGKFYAAKLSEFSLFLQRSFWKPLRNMMEIFHVLPLAAAVILFVLFATDGQLREIYISYLEGPVDAAWVASIVAALASIVLLSAVLYVAHNALSRMRIHVVYSSHPDPQAYSSLRRVQRAAAFALAFMPWAGLTIGLFSARNFVAARYCQLLDIALVDPYDLQKMQFLPQVNGLEIAAAVIVLGAMTAFFASVDDRNRIAHGAVALIAPAFAVLLFLLFTDRLSADAWISWWSQICAIVAVATVIYLTGYYYLYHTRGAFILSRAFTHTGISFRKRRRRRLAVWAFLPWLFFAFYFASVWLFAAGAVSSSSCSGRLVSTATTPAPGRWAIFPIAMCCTLAIGLLVGHFILRLGVHKWFQRIVIIVVAGLAAAGVLLSFYNDGYLTVFVYRFIGPLATVSLELLFLISAFALLAVLSQRSQFPALTLIVLTMIVCLIFPNYAGRTAVVLGLVYFSFAVIAFASGRKVAGVVLMLLIFVGWLNVKEFNEGSAVRQNPAAEKAAANAAAPNLKNVRTAYLCWLDQKAVPAVRTAEQQQSCVTARPDHPPPVYGKYTVFIVAAEGGGIYAASSAATFLAKLEDVEPGFAEHIFAISGVSGGSIGAAVFQALDHARHPNSHSAPAASADVAAKSKDLSEPVQPETCTQQAGVKVGSDLAAKVADIMEDDHFSPIVGSIFPEIFNAPFKRPDALRASFEYSASMQDLAAGNDLCAPFGEHWSIASAAPALVLNSTWVEMGFRVAFAPFRLHDLDESLYSFLDPSMPDEGCRNSGGGQSCVSLMTAAGVSARFPGIMPPFSVKMYGDKYWNFVDGAYSDNSGATTALDLYEALKGAVPDTDVDLRIVLITSANPQPRLDDKSINGTIFRDTVAPIDAIMKVREDLGNDAVARACSEIYRDAKNLGGHVMEVNEGCIDHAGVADGKLQIVEIQDQSYGLPLGWKISQTSFAVVSWMLGEPDKCLAVKNAVSNDKTSQAQTPVQNDDNQNAQLTNIILQRNSCVSQLILNLIRQSSVPDSTSPGQ